MDIWNVIIKFCQTSLYVQSNFRLQPNDHNTCRQCTFLKTKDNVASLCFFRFNFQFYVVTVWLGLGTRTTWSGKRLKNVFWSPHTAGDVPKISISASICHEVLLKIHDSVATNAAKDVLNSRQKYPVSSTITARDVWRSWKKISTL